jgi:hypothetical protein
MSPGDQVATSAFAPSPASAAEIERTVAPVSRSQDVTVTVRAKIGQAPKPASATAKASRPPLLEVLQPFNECLFIVFSSSSLQNMSPLPLLAAEVVGILSNARRDFL